MIILTKAKEKRNPSAKFPPQNNVKAKKKNMKLVLESPLAYNYNPSVKPPLMELITKGSVEGISSGSTEVLTNYTMTIWGWLRFVRPSDAWPSSRQKNGLLPCVLLPFTPYT
jgi:hypothetical protein